MESTGNGNHGSSISAWSKDGQNSSKMDSRQINNNAQKVSTADDIPTLPDVDDLVENTHRSLSIEKPSNSSATYEELDSELLKQYSYTSLDGVNMSPLLKFIHPDVHLKEPDVVWTVDSLFNDLAEYYKEEKK